LANQNIEEYIIPVGVDVSTPEWYQFSVATDQLDYLNIVLEDRKENIFTNLRWDTYQAYISESGIGRFYLHFKDATFTTETQPQTNITVSFDNEKIRLNNPQNEKGKINVCSVSGQTILSETLDNTTVQILDIHIVPGVYIVNIQSDKAMISKKIIVK